MHIVEDAGFLGWINEVDLWNSSSGRCDFMCYHSYGLRVTGVFFIFFIFHSFSIMDYLEEYIPGEIV